MYGAAVALVILQQPDKARSQLKNITNITWTMEVCGYTCRVYVCANVIMLGNGEYVTVVLSVLRCFCKYNYLHLVFLRLPADSVQCCLLSHCCL